jgi:hypothetical protein
LAQQATFEQALRKVRNRQKLKLKKMKTKSLTKVTLLTLMVVSFITAVTLNSCQKEVVRPKAKGSKSLTATGSSAASLELIMSELNNMVFSSSGTKGEKGMGQNFNFWDTTGGVIFTIDTISKPHTTTYNFGSGCVGSDGKTRAGVVVISYDNRDIRVVNDVYTISLQNYTITSSQVTGGNSQVTTNPSTSPNSTGNTVPSSSPITTVTGFNGSVSYTNTGYNGNGNLVLVEAGSFVALNGSNTDTVNMGFQYEWIAGVNSSPLSNLQFKVTGTSYGSSSQGSMDTLTITSALTKSCKTTGCNFCSLGTTTLSSNTSSPKYSDFSIPGGCSGQVQVTVNGVASIQNQ